MCFIFPAFIIIGIMAAKKQGLGLLLIPILFVKGFTLLFSVALGAILRPFYHLAGNPGEIILYLSVSAVFLVLIAVYFRDMKIHSNQNNM